MLRYEWREERGIMDNKIGLQKELDTYHLSGKWNDYVGVQKRVVNILKEEGFFENNIVVNDDSKMVIRITAKGIKETLSKGKRFQNLPRRLKELKVATLRSIPMLIQLGTLFADDVQNIHGENSVFAYLTHEIMIDEEVYKVRISIKRKAGSNIFWMHNIDCKEKSLELLDLRS